jgi:ribulose-5-phosphate 4-epimerase/fuculose-1-phosphate aldolase
MHPDRPRQPAELSELIDSSIRLGADLRLVQGAGGNLSVKTGGTMWIKASGTRLGQATERQIFVPMDEAATREAVLVTEELTPFVLPEAQESGLRPSIETALHVLLPHTVVFHAHGVGAIAAGLTARVEEALGQLPDEFDRVVVPYTKPGVQLARAVLAAMPAGLTTDRPLVLVLRNHGLVVGAADCATAERVLAQVEAHFRSVEAPTVAHDLNDLCLCPPGTVGDLAAEVLCAGALTPDSAVFLGPQPFGRTVRGPGQEDSPHAGFVADDGSVWLRPGLGADEREVAASLVDVARQVIAGPVSILTPEQVDELVNWEAEKWRQQLKR